MRRAGLLIVAALALTLGLVRAQSPDPVTPATKAMAALLAERAAAVGPGDLWFNVNDKRASTLADAVERSRSTAERFRLRVDLAGELLYAGRYAESVALVDALLKDVQALGPAQALFAQINLLQLQATTYLRWGEEQNCAEGHNRDSCLLPIKGQGVHQRRDGSQRAIAVLDRLLKIDPGNLRARWLLNIAHMTLGSYPDGLEPAVLISPTVFAAAHPLKPFENVAASVGLDIYGLSGGAVLEDFDRDGLLDLVVTSVGFQDQMRVFRNDGSGRFIDRTAESGLAGITGGLNMVHADYDNDGRVDVLVLRGAWMGDAGRFPVSLLRNVGNLRFEDVTTQAGLLRLRPTQTATWFDYNGDGFLDLYIGNESTGRVANPCELYRNNRDGTFSEVARQAGVDIVGFVKAVVSGDYDNDGDPDLFLSIARGANVLFRNDGPAPPSGATTGGWRFTNVAAQAGVEAPRDSFPAMFFDYDNDGWLDLYVASYWGAAEDVAADYLGQETAAERGRLYRNNRDGTFADVTKAMGLYTVMQVMGLNFGDLDNDGWLDFYAGTGNPDFHTLVPNRLFRNDGGKRFQDVTTSANVGHLQKGHAIAWGDVDNDGDQDIFEQMGGAYQADRAYSVLYRESAQRAEHGRHRARGRARQSKRHRRPRHDCPGDPVRSAVLFTASSVPAAASAPRRCGWTWVSVTPPPSPRCRSDGPTRGRGPRRLARSRFQGSSGGRPIG